MDNIGQSPFLIGNSTINSHFSYVKFPEGTNSKVFTDVSPNSDIIPDAPRKSPIHPLKHPHLPSKPWPKTSMNPSIVPMDGYQM